MKPLGIILVLASVLGAASAATADFLAGAMSNDNTSLDPDPIKKAISIYVTLALCGVAAVIPGLLSVWRRR